MERLHGIMTALVTPFKNGALDEDSLRAMTRRQIDAGVHGLVPLGSTGEAATLSFDERATVIKAVVEEAAGKLPVIVGAGHNSTTQTVELVKQAKDLGADAALVVMPYYNKPTQLGGLKHFQTAYDETQLPIVVYNVPGRTGSNITPQLADGLAELDGFIGIKEASGNMSQVMEIARRTRSKWAVISGEDGLFLPFLAVGGSGLISVTSNIAPEQMVDIYNRWIKGDTVGARTAQLKMLPLINAMFRVSNPIPVKAACSLMGLCKNELRLPLLPLDDELVEPLEEELEQAGLL